MPLHVLILGSGFTGSRVARRLSNRGIRVTALSRADADFTRPEVRLRLASIIPRGCIVLHSLPTLPDGADREIIATLGNKPSRLVYLSTTAVYGECQVVDETTPSDPRSERELSRA